MSNGNSVNNAANLSLGAPLAIFLIFGYMGRQMADNPKALVITGIVVLVLLVLSAFSGVYSIISFIKSRTKGVLVKGIFGTILSVLILLLLSLSMLGGVSKANSNSLQLFVDQSAQYFPKQMDADTRCDSLSVGGVKTLIQHFTLVNVSVKELDTSAFREIMTPQIVQGYESSEAYEWPRNNGIEMLMVYSDKVGQLICKIETN